jgi:hypothetical protein
MKEGKSRDFEKGRGGCASRKTAKRAALSGPKNPEPEQIKTRAIHRYSGNLGVSSRSRVP